MPGQESHVPDRWRAMSYLYLTPVWPQQPVLARPLGCALWHSHPKPPCSGAQLHIQPPSGVCGRPRDHPERQSAHRSQMTRRRAAECRLPGVTAITVVIQDGARHACVLCTLRTPPLLCFLKKRLWKIQLPHSSSWTGRWLWGTLTTPGDD